MFGSSVLDIGVGLILTYLLFSLIVTTLSELWTAWFHSRGRYLVRGIRDLLDGTSELPSQWKKSNKLQPCAPSPTERWSHAFFQHQLVNSLTTDEQKPSYVPSHIFATVLLHLVQRNADGKNLTSDLHAPAGAPDSILHAFATFDDIAAVIRRVDNKVVSEALLPLLELARNDMTSGVTAVQKFMGQIEIWFDNAMDRVTGWYKKRTQWLLFWIAVVAAVLVNVDTIAIAKSLGKNDALRASVVAVASQTRSPATQPSSEIKSENLGATLNQLGQDVGRLEALGIPIGWTYEDLDEKTKALKNLREGVTAADTAVTAKTQELKGIQPDHNNLWSDKHRKFMDCQSQLSALTKQASARKKELQTASLAQTARQTENLYYLFNLFNSDVDGAIRALWFVEKLLGLLLTACAASLGAPFWFDLLNKFMSIRAAGKAPEEKPKSPKEVLQPQAPKT